MTTPSELAFDIATLLRGTRLRISQEKVLQNDIQAALDRAGIDYGREHALSAGDRPGFMCGGVVIEAKARYAKRSIFRQLERYALHEEVSDIVLVSGTAMGMPAEINGKPVLVVSIGMSFL